MALKPSELALIFNQLASILANTPQTAAAAQGGVGLAQDMAASEYREEQEKAEKKAKKGGLLGQIGATAAGLAAAPFTAGMSIPAAAAISGGAAAAGGALGQLAGSGNVSMDNVLVNAVTGALSGGTGAAQAGAGADKLIVAPMKQAAANTTQAVPNAATEMTSAMSEAMPSLQLTPRAGAPLVSPGAGAAMGTVPTGATDAMSGKLQVPSLDQGIEQIASQVAGQATPQNTFLSKVAGAFKEKLASGELNPLIQQLAASVASPSPKPVKASRALRSSDAAQFANEQLARTRLEQDAQMNAAQIAAMNANTDINRKQLGLQEQRLRQDAMQFDKTFPLQERGVAVDELRGKLASDLTAQQIEQLKYEGSPRIRELQEAKMQLDNEYIRALTNNVGNTGGGSGGNDPLTRFDRDLSFEDLKNYFSQAIGVAYDPNSRTYAPDPRQAETLNDMITETLQEVRLGRAKTVSEAATRILSSFGIVGSGSAQPQQRMANINGQLVPVVLDPTTGKWLPIKEQ